ncbi:hypothetical protein FXO38_27698 [Capsicum annuum]|nr:hypothetical protein FXO38_27698 [Capsicum annuum]
MPEPNRAIAEDELVLPYGKKWTRGLRLNSEAHHALVPMRDQLDHMTEEQSFQARGDGAFTLGDDQRAPTFISGVVKVLDGPVFPEVEFMQPPASPGRGGRERGRGCRRGRGRGRRRRRRRGGDPPVRRGGRGRGRLSFPLLPPIEPEPEIHQEVDPEPHPAAHVEHIPNIDTAQIPSFDPSPSTLDCSSMSQPHHFSIYIVPSWVDEEVRESYDDMHYRDVATPLRLSFGSTEFGDISTCKLRDEEQVIRHLNKKILEMKKTLEIFHELDDLNYQRADEKEH